MSHVFYIALRCYFLILFLIQRSLHTFSPLRTRCVQNHRRFTLHACQFLNERELAVLPLKHSYFLLCFKAVLCLRGKSHSFCTTKSSCILQRESLCWRVLVLPQNSFHVTRKQKLWSKSCVLMVLSTYCLFSSYGCFPVDIYHGNIYAPGNIPASVISSDFSEPLWKVINLFPSGKKKLVNKISSTCFRTG